MTRMHLTTARQIAEDVVAHRITTADWPARREDIHRAFHRLDRSDPATVELRKQDMFLARSIWAFVGTLPQDESIGGQQKHPLR